MAQVLKEEIRQRIYDSAVEVFYQKDFRSATMKDIAKSAKVPVGLIYSYYDNKETLFDAVVQSVLVKYPEVLEQAQQNEGFELENYELVEKPFYASVFENYKQFVILMVKSDGTRFSNAKEEMIAHLEAHLKMNIKEKQKADADDFFVHLIASNVVDNLIHIARHYKSQEWALAMTDEISELFFNGIKNIK